MHIKYKMFFSNCLSLVLKFYEQPLQALVTQTIDCPCFNGGEECQRFMEDQKGLDWEVSSPSENYQPHSTKCVFRESKKTKTDEKWEDVFMISDFVTYAKRSIHMLFRKDEVSLKWKVIGRFVVVESNIQILKEPNSYLLVH